MEKTPMNQKKTAYIRRSAILKAVASGLSLEKAGNAIGVSEGHARQLLHRLRREIGFDMSVAGIRKNPTKYLRKLKAIDELYADPVADLRPSLVTTLIGALKIQKSTLSPKYVSNITVSQLRDRGLTYVAVSEIQRWLAKYGLSLKRCPPQIESELMNVERWIDVLDAYHFDTKAIREQLAHLVGSDG